MNNGNPTPSERYWLCPLYSFNCDCESVDLNNGIQIKQASDNLKDYLLKEFTLESDPIAWHTICGNLKYMVVFPERSVPKGVLGNRSVWQASRLLLNLITAFRLCHAGKVAPGPLLDAEADNSISSIADIPPGCVTDVGMLSPKDTSELFAFGSEYKLRKSDVPQVNELVKHLSELRHKKAPDSLELALERFNSSYYGKLEDRLIDQMIAFEYLYIGDDKELGYKLALRMAFLIGQRPGEISSDIQEETTRELIFIDMKKAYDLRSKVVHGSKQLEQSEFEKIIPKTEEYLRQSIRRFLSLLSAGYSLEELKKGKANQPAKLELNILNNGWLPPPNNPRRGQNATLSNSF